MKAITLPDYLAPKILSRKRTTKVKNFKTNYRGDLVIVMNGQARFIVNLTQCEPFNGNYAWRFTLIYQFQYPFSVEVSPGMFDVDIRL